MTCSRPDISYSVGILSRYMHQPRELHWRYLKRLLKYIHTTKSYRLKFAKHDNKISLTGYCDSDYASSVEDRKSISGYVFQYNDSAISWNSAKQKQVSLSSTEADYIAKKCNKRRHLAKTITY